MKHATPTPLLFSAHARSVMKLRDIKTEWVEFAVQHPDYSWPDPVDLACVHFIRRIAIRGNKPLRVVVNVTVSPKRVVTAFFDRRLLDRI